MPHALDHSAGRFLSSEDLDLRALSDEDFDRLAAAAFRAAQRSNDEDEHCYRSGSLAVEPGFERLLPLLRNGVL